MNKILHNVATSMTLIPKDVEKKYLAEKTFTQELDFPDPLSDRKRRVSHLVSGQSEVCIKKARLMQAGRRYFVENLSSIIGHEQILSECPFFYTPIHLDDGSKYTTIKTAVCSEPKQVEDLLITLGDTELAFVVYYEEFSDRVKILLSLFSNKSGEKEVKNMIGGYLGGGLEFFAIALTLNFDSDDNLTTVYPGRGVNERFRRKKICSSVSLSALKQIYKHLGSENTKMASYSALHIATVKFYYPLNSFFRKSTNESLRHFDPRSAKVMFDDIEKRQESLDVFQVKGTYARCPDKYINLEMLLFQHEMRDVLNHKAKST